LWSIFHFSIRFSYNFPCILHFYVNFVEQFSSKYCISILTHIRIPQEWFSHQLTREHSFETSIMHCWWNKLHISLTNHNNRGRHWKIGNHAGIRTNIKPRTIWKTNSGKGKFTLNHDFRHQTKTFAGRIEGKSTRNPKSERHRELNVILRDSKSDWIPW
jgi:hypothetical protein